MKKAIFPLGLAALAILALLCVRSNAPRIEKDILSRTESALKSAGLQFATVRVDGRDVRIEGTAPSETAQKAAAELVSGVLGVRSVEAAMTIAKAAEPPAPRKWTLALDRQADTIVLSGMLPNETMRDRFVQILQPMAGAAGLDQRITLTPESPEAWQNIMAAVARYLDEFTRVTVELSADALRVAGEMKSDKARSQFIQFLQGLLPPGVAAAFEISIPPMTTAAVSCQQELDALLAKTTIRFESESTAVSAESMDLLRQLVVVMRNCPKVRFKIAGHTDASGSEDFNLKLSQGRAQAVTERLIELGVEPGRITTIGYGESRPVADNATEAGRALNRRIEFIITED